MTETSPATLKHWRTFGAAEWSHVRVGLIGLVLGTLLPVVLFYLGLRAWGFSAGVLIVLGWSALVFAWHYRRTSRADVFSATTFGFACVKAAAGLVSQNTLLYLAWPSLENMVYGTAFFGSALLARPLLALYAERLYPIPAAVRVSASFQRAFLIASAVWLCGHTLRAIVRLCLLWLLEPQSLELYLLADTVVGWPINVSLVAFTTWFPLRELRRAGYMVAPQPLSPIEAVELGVEETAPRTV
jgi:intracellular septation protein A